MASRTDRHNLVTISSCAYLVWMFCMQRNILAPLEMVASSVIILSIVISSQGATGTWSCSRDNEIIPPMMPSLERNPAWWFYLQLVWCGFVFFQMCGWAAARISFYRWLFTLMPRHLGCRDQCCRSFLCQAFALHSSCLVQKAACWCTLLSTGENPMVVHYFITVRPAAAGCVTCFSILICSATRYSFSALLHLIRTGCVPLNNGIMTGTGWFLVLVLSASWPSARA